MELLTYLFKSAIVLTVFYLAYRILLHRDTLFIWNRHFLLLGMVISLLLPFWEITQVVVVEVPASIPQGSTDLMADALPQSSMQVTTSESSMTPMFLLSILYIIGFLFFSVQWFRQAWSLIVLLSRYPKISYEGIYHVRTDEAQAPFSFMNYVVYNPKLHSPKELEMILKHEKVHIKERHSIDMVFSQLFCLLQWFNPIAWSYRKLLSENLEFLADRRTLTRVDCPKSYQLALVRTSSILPAPMLANSFYQSFIKKRIVMLNKNHSSAYNALKALLVLPLLALFLYSFNLKTEKKFVELPMEPKVEKVMEKEKGNHSEDLVSSNLLDIKEVPETQVQAQPISTPSDKPVAQTLIKEFKFLITKNTTDAELASLKKKLKEEHNIDLNYSSSRNSSGEITSLSISYSGNGKNGNYQVTDDEGIETFTFYMSDEGETGFYSDSMEARKLARKAQMQERKTVILEEMETRREALEQRREEREKQLRVEMEERKENLEDRRKEIRVRISDEEEELEDNVFELERIRSDRDGKVIVIDKLGKDVDFEVLEHPETIYVKSIEKSFGVITKNTTNEDLENLKRKLSKENVDFSFRNVRRNSKGEITGLKFSVKDDNGKSTTHVKGNNNDPIDTIIIR